MRIWIARPARTSRDKFRLVGRGFLNRIMNLSEPPYRFQMAGLAIQPFLAAIVAFFAFPVFLLDRNGETLAGGHPYDSTDAAASVAFGTGLVALFMTIAAVLPTALWLTRRFQLSLRDALLFGLGFGNL